MLSKWCLRVERKYAREQQEKGNDPTPVQELKLRPYQEELVKAVCSGNRPNTLVACETNSGKTLVAFKAILHWRQNNPLSQGKFAFITHSVALCEQQYRNMCSFVPSDKVAICHGETVTSRNVFLDAEFEGLDKAAKDVFLFTAQSFLNFLEKKTFALEQYTLIVFDECHHTDLKHPYNEVMLRYLHLKLNGASDDGNNCNLPQILGLTASPTVFEQTILDEQDARQNLQKLLFNLDATEISTVVGEISSLREHCMPSFDTIEFVHLSMKSKFEKEVEELMSKQIAILKKAYSNYKVEIEQGTPSFSISLQFPGDLASQTFEQWAREIGKKNSNHTKFQVCLTFISRVLIQLNLILNMCRIIEYAILLERLKSFYHDLLFSASDGDVDPEIKKLYDTFEKVFFDLTLPDLKEAAVISKMDGDHKMMNKLRDILVQELIQSSSGDGDVKNRGIVFVQKRLEAEILKNWAAEDSDLMVDLNPQFITAETKEQNQLLESFRSGRCRLIFATSVIEEGIDIPDCKLVINYNNHINHIQQLQQKGRARMNEGKYYVISCTRSFHDLANANTKRQRLTDIAISNLVNEMNCPAKKEKILRDMKSYQITAVEKFLEGKAESKSKPLDGHLFLFKCTECLHEICDSDQIRIFKGSFRILLVPNHKAKFREQKLTLDPKTKKYYDSIDMQCSTALFCAQCKNKLGQLLKYGFCGLINPVLEKYMVEHATNCPKCVENNETIVFDSKPFKKWKLVPFSQKDITALDVKTFYADLESLGKPQGGFQALIDNTD